jgi:nucleoside-diphosphate-sugar epimerase
VAISCRIRDRAYRENVELILHKFSGGMKDHLLQSFEANEREELRGKTFFVSGATGFVGKWIIQVLLQLFVDEEPPTIVAISRSKRKASEIYSNYSNVIVCDWDTFQIVIKSFQKSEKVVGIHSSVPAASGEVISSGEIQYFSGLTESFARALSVQFNSPSFINLSSGGIYIRPQEGTIPEQDSELKILNLSPYESIKIRDEQITTKLTQMGDLRGSNPRLFSFTGPGLEIPGKFAISNFVGDAVAGREVIVRGSPDSLRSYMSPIDLSVWILRTSLYPTLETLHIGSPESYSMKEIAKKVSNIFGNGEVRIINSDKAKTESYVPDVVTTNALLKVKDPIDLDQSLNFWCHNFQQF